MVQTTKTSTTQRATRKKRKIFVLDTNVLLHDYKCIYKFEENDIYIPITVLEELDRFKKGSDIINYQAREFTRELDKISGDKLFTEGVKIGTQGAKLFIETSNPFTEKLKQTFFENTPDHRILGVADALTEKYPKRTVVLITKDINLRMKAKSLGIASQDYENDKIRDIDVLYGQTPIIENYDKEIISRFYKEPDGLPLEEVPLERTFMPNSYFILRCDSASVLVTYNPFVNRIMRVEKKNSYGIEPRNAEQAFALDALNNQDIKLVAITGKAGTGKTLVALAAALHQRKNYRQIYLARPIVPLSNRDIGYLPGDAKEKIGPYMQPLFDNLSVIRHQFKQESQDYQRIDDMLKTEKLLISPLAYIRGRSLSNVFFIVDEAQNLTPHEIKTIITRAGEGAKMIFTGDVQQIDSPYLDAKSNGLTYLTDKMKGQDIFGHINMIKGERSSLADLASDLL